MKLIVNADDFALTLGVTKGIIKGMQEGIITDTSVFTNSIHFEESIELAKQHGMTSMGVHLTITFSKPVLEASKVRSLVDSSGDFFKKPDLIPKTYRTEELRSELQAQIEKFLSTGLTLNHLNTHHGFTVLDSEMMEVVSSLAKEYRVPMRREDVFTKDISIKKKFLTLGINLTDNILISTPNVNEDSIMCILEEHKNGHGTFEIVGHPGFIDHELQNLTSLINERQRDLEMFMNPELMKYIDVNNIELISFSNLI